MNECGVISHSGSCAECALERLNANITELHARSGPSMLRWRRAIAASVGAVLLDDVNAQAQ